MDIHRTEEEQVEAIKKWWKENGTSVVLGVVLGIAAIYGVRYWMNYKETQQQQASLLYAQVVNSLASDKAKAETMASKMAADYASTPYASLTALQLAAVKVKDKDFAAARNYLQWVLDNGNDQGLKHVARIRLVRLLLEDNLTDKAEAMLKDARGSGFDSEYAELRGDIALAKGDKASALNNYQQAKLNSPANTQRTQLLQMKIDDLAVSQ